MQRCCRLKAYWTEKQLIEVRSTHEGISNLAVASKPNDWVNRAWEYYNRHQYGQAVSAFRRAQLPREAAVASAHVLQGIAQRCVEDGGSRFRAFERAADAFRACVAQASGDEDRGALFYKAGECYTAARKSDKATTAFVDAAKAFTQCAADLAPTSSQQKIFYRRAAECYEGIKRYRQAAEAYVLAFMFTKAVVNYRDARLLESAVEVILRHNDLIDVEVAEHVKETARFEFLSKQKVE